jgi:hypothetical protein
MAISVHPGLFGKTTGAKRSPGNSGVFRFTEKRYSVRFVLVVLPLRERCKRYFCIAA